MILSLVGKYRKATAGFMSAIFAVQLLWPMGVSAKQPIYSFPRKSSKAVNFLIKPYAFKALNNYIPKENLPVNLHTAETFVGVKNINTEKQQVEKLKMVDLREEEENPEKKESEKYEKGNIGGPGQPEMSSFQSVNGNNMVDLFTGDFSYNIPLMDVGGYPINIHYNSGITMDQEASWVGLGFNINPGTITRNMRGLPDDFNGTDSITKIQNIKQNKTTGVKLGAQAEIKGSPLTVGAGVGVFHNNYNGWGIEQSLNAAISLSLKSKGSLTSGDSSSTSLNLGLGINNNSQTGLSVSPSLNVKLEQFGQSENMKSSNFGISTNYHSRAGLSSLTISAQSSKLFGSLQRFIPNSVDLSFSQPSVTPTISMPTTSQNFVFHAKTGGEAFGFHGNIFIEGYVNKQGIKKEDQVQKLPAYGYLYLTDANNNQRALLDYNREKELQFNYKSTPNIAIPQYTYDVYSVSGEGTGGTIRPYRGDVGYVSDHYMRTKSSNDQFSLEIGGGWIFHAGFSYDFVKSYTENSAWNQQNNMKSKIGFQQNDSLYQSVYFRNPGEKTSNTAAYYQQVGDDALIRVKLNRTSLPSVSAMNRFVKFKGGNATGDLLVDNKIVKKDRDKRSQVVTYLNAQEAATYGLDKNIYSYKENTIPIGPCQDTLEIIQRIDNNSHKKNHLSEIDVLNSDGRRYVYGLPAYNIEQKDVTFSVDKENNLTNIDSGLVVFSGGTDNSVNNNKGKENYFNKEIVPAYAHSFLLTGVLSPDYVDIKNDGITEDDLGDAVKFNYTRVYGPQQDYFEWRTPGSRGKANYNEGFKTYSRDDKGTYLYGKKEVWYTHSIESKTMIALFKISSDRKDAYAAADENGGINKNKTLRKLERIELYTKADLVKSGIKAKPVKTVHFEYNYDLCKGYNGNSSEGKLTLKKIWFSYNANEKGKQNPYTFTYNSSNPNYHPKKYDRWGNYKDQSSNPGGLNNGDFPYAAQDSTIAAQNAGAWNLTGIKLPSGGRMKITYESDDYGYVQNKRAQQMFTVAGFGKTPSDNPSSNLYGGSDYDYVFINSTIPVADANDVFKKYLEGNEWIYMKMAVIMPSDRWGSGYEFVPVYGKISEYGKVNGINRFWIKFEKVQGVSPMLRSAFQFLKNNLPSKAYPTSELGDNVDLGDAVKMLLSSIGEIKNTVAGFERASMSKGWCKSVDISKSFIRLNSPEYKKLGGGLRVKKVEIFDNWNSMTNQRESVYGQEYSYRTSIEVNGQKQVISSGVATYEPMIGNEENPFRQPINYSERIAPLAPVSFLYSEMPLGESFFPGASVGYSKVRVRTINSKAKSANGWEETEFYTSKDFPTLVEHTLLDQDAKARYKPKLPSLLKIYSVERTTVSQGFKIELNDMNGKVKRNASYAESDSLNPVSYSLNFYKVDNDRSTPQKLNNSVWVVDSINGKINKNGIIGKDIEVMTDFRQQYSLSVSGGISPNLDYFQIGIFPVPLPSFFKFPQFDETQFRSAATVKIVQRYAILDSVVVMDKGSVVSTKNMLYDGETGEVILSRTNNEFNDPIYNFSYPAHWAYTGMGMAYKNVQAVFTGLKAINGKLYYPGTNASFPSEKYFEGGDELWLNGKTQIVSGGESCLNFDPLLSGAGTPIDEKAWIIDAIEGKEKNKGLYMINKDGVPFTGIINMVKVLRSGKRNILDASAGNIVSMDNPIKEVTSGNYKVVIDSSIRIINASVSTYKDLWQVENGLFPKDTTIRVYKQFRPIYLTPSVTTKRYTELGGIAKPEENISNSKNIAGSFDYVRYRNLCTGSLKLFTKSILVFDFSILPQNAIITSATLQLSPRVPKDLWFRISSGKSICGKLYSYDWPAATNFYTGQSTALLKRVTADWNSNTPYHSVQTTTVNQVSITNAGYQNIDCRNLIQDISKNRRYGLVFELIKNSVASNSSETNYLNFGSRLEQNVNKPYCGIPYQMDCSTQAPVLSINYMAEVDTTITVCRYNLNDTAINPYKWGVLGNWRIDKAYTYFKERKESDASDAQTDIRKEGTLNKFTPYWNFTDEGLIANSDTTKWVWNTAMSGYNRKGFEIENFDPLGRYNSGLYGYNQTLPVAVTQNSKNREILYDGFEDYGYKTKNCTTCESPREFDFIKNQPGVTLSQVESHTGKYSIKINAGSESRLTAPVINNINDSTAGLSIKVDSTPVYNINVVGKGKGLTGIYKGRTLVNNNCTPQSFSGTRIDSTINFNWGSTSPFPGMCFRTGLLQFINYDVSWTGKIQARFTGSHRFFLEYMGIANVSITRGTKTVSLTSTGTNGKYHTDTIFLKSGELYNITIRYSKSSFLNSQVKLSWSVDQNLAEQIVPKNYLYPSDMTLADTVGSIQRNVRFYCIKLNNVKPRQVIKPVFSPTQGSKMIVSAWAKLEGTDCNTAPALSDVIVVSFDKGGISSTVSLQKTGVRIEGWQRYESIVDVPVNATQVYLSLKGAQGRIVYVDDVRMQPFNSNAKSYVYDPVSLRLMAELDENNYAAFYEYDDDGTLIRVKKETEKGIMTIKETRSALIKDDE